MVCGSQVPNAQTLQGFDRIVRMACQRLADNCRQFTLALSRQAGAALQVVDHGDLFHTYLSAVGLESLGSFDIGGRDQPMADPAKGPISELIS